MLWDEKPSMADYGVTQDLLDRVDWERERRLDVDRRFWASRREESPGNSEEANGCSGTILAVMAGAFFLGTTPVVCLGIPIVAIMGDRDPFFFLRAIGVVGAVLGAILAGTWSIRNDWRLASRRKDEKPASVAPDYFTGAVASDEEIARADRFRSALSEWEQDSWGGWQSLSGLEFEERFASLLRRAGWRVTQTKASGDGGVDLWCTDGKGHRAAIQCKWWSKPCGVKPIRELVGVLSAKDGYCRGIVICKSGFTKEAKEFAAGSRIVLWDSSVVLDLLKHNRVPHLG